MKQELTTVQKHLSRGGALCKEFNRVRYSEDMDWRREQAYALSAINSNKQLQRCTPESVGRALVDLSVMGLTLSPAMKEAYLIPYGQECTASPSYMGLVNILARTGVLAPPYVETEVVREGDHWREWADPLHGKMFEHEFGKERGKVIHAWAVFTLSNGTKKVVTMDRAALMACRDAAARQNNDNIPWVWKGPFREEMYKKAPIRRGWKLLPKMRDPRLIAMLEAVDRTDPLDFDGKPVAPPITDVTTLAPENIEALCEIMRTNGVPESGFNKWLDGLAASMNYPDGIRTVLIKDYDAVASQLEKGIERWKQMSSQSEASDSVQEDTTAQTVET